MKLGQLIGTADDAVVTGFAIDHRKVAPGTIFGAFEGARVNGEDYIEAAVQAGAIAVVARPEAKVEGAVHIADTHPRERFAHAAARLDNPGDGEIVGGDDLRRPRRPAGRDQFVPRRQDRDPRPPADRERRMVRRRRQRDIAGGEPAPGRDERFAFAKVHAGVA